MEGTVTKEEDSEMEMEDVDPDKDSNRYMAVLVEALSILGKVQDALDVRQQSDCGCCLSRSGCGLCRRFRSGWRRSFF